MPWSKFFKKENSKNSDAASGEHAAVQIITLFIVDDNPVFAQMVHSYLKNKEKSEPVLYSAEIFYNAEDCLNNLYKKPDIILLDYYLSPNADGMNGGDVFEKIMEYNPAQKVVMLSGQEEANVVLKLIKSGLRDYIMKDDEMFEHLHETIVEVFQNKKNKKWSAE